MKRNRDNMGIFESAYYIIADFLLREQKGEQGKNTILMPTCLDGYVKSFYNKGSANTEQATDKDSIIMEIDNPSIFLVDPIHTNLDGGYSVDWAKMGLTPANNNIIGTIFHLSYEESYNMELNCGLIINPYKITIVYGDKKYKRTEATLPFVYGDIYQEIYALTEKKEWDKIFTKYPDVYDLVDILVTTVHEMLVGSEETFQDTD